MLARRVVAPLVHHWLLAAALLALAGASLRIASPIAARGLDRVLVATTTAAALVIALTLASSLARLGGSPIALAGGTAAIWLTARALLPRPGVPIGAELANWWRGLTDRHRVGLGALAGLGAAHVAFLLRHPSLGIDAVTYHTSELVRWLHAGTPGSVQEVTLEFPVGAYPVTGEVLIAWATGISHSFVPVSLAAPAAALLLLVAGWHGLRVLGAPRRAAGLALAGLLTSPLVISLLTSAPNTDLPALAWAVVCGALCVRAVRHDPVLLIPAVVAGALSVGTKTTTAVAVAFVLGLAGWACRRELRRLSGPLALAFGAALLVGGTWYLRNLVVHGSPLWPFLATPFGDPLPEFFREHSVRLIERPGATVRDLGPGWLRHLGGVALILAAAPLLAVLAGRRSAQVAAGFALLSVAIWTVSPFTGTPDEPGLLPLVSSTLRYLAPGLAAAAAAVALAACGRRVAAHLATAALALAIGVNVLRAVDIGYPFTPSARVLAVGALAGAAGAALVALAPRARARLGPPALPMGARLAARSWGPAARAAIAGVIALGATLAAAAGLALAADGYVERHAATGRTFNAPLTRWFLEQPGFGSQEAEIAFLPRTIGVLSGDRLVNDVELLPAAEPCTQVRRRLDRGWLVLEPLLIAGVDDPYPSLSCLRGLRPALATRRFVVFGGLEDGAPAASLDRPG